MKVVVWLTYYDDAVQQFNSYATGTIPKYSEYDNEQNPVVILQFWTSDRVQSHPIACQIYKSS